MTKRDTLVRIQTRSERLVRLIDLDAPEVIVSKARVLLRYAIDSWLELEKDDS